MGKILGWILVFYGNLFKWKTKIFQDKKNKALHKSFWDKIAQSELVVHNNIGVVLFTSINALVFVSIHIFLFPRLNFLLKLFYRRDIFTGFVIILRFDCYFLDFPRLIRRYSDKALRIKLRPEVFSSLAKIPPIKNIFQPYGKTMTPLGWLKYVTVISFA